MNEFQKELQKLRAKEQLAYYADLVINKYHPIMGEIDLPESICLSLILREIAVDLDKFYPDHIENSEKIFCISMTNGQIVQVNKSKIVNYRNFAAFRSIDDAKIACGIVSPILRTMFKDGRKQKSKKR